MRSDFVCAPPLQVLFGPPFEGWVATYTLTHTHTPRLKRDYIDYLIPGTVSPTQFSRSPSLRRGFKILEIRALEILAQPSSGYLDIRARGALCSAGVPAIANRKNQPARYLQRNCIVYWLRARSALRSGFTARSHEQLPWPLTDWRLQELCL